MHSCSASAAHHRRVLLAVTGLSPQIVTETLWALAVDRQPRWIPTEIRTITTQRGNEKAERNLRSADPGWGSSPVRRLPPAADRVR